MEKLSESQISYVFYVSLYVIEVGMLMLPAYCTGAKGHGETENERKCGVVV